MKSFHLREEDWKPPWKLEGPEAHHCLKVLRLRTGEEVRLFDGQGREGLFAIRQVEKNRLFLDPLKITEQPLPLRKTVLALAFTKGLRRSWLLEKAVELEASDLWLWQADRSQGSLPEEVKESWEGQLIAGAKQCGNPWLPSLSVFPGGLGDLLAHAPSPALRLTLSVEPQAAMLSAADVAATEALFLLGPEGGFSPREEILLAESGVHGRSLGRCLLRWETAALTLLGLRFWAGHQPDALREDARGNAATAG